MPRAARLDTQGILLHVMIQGIERRKVFREDDDRQDMLDRPATLLAENVRQSVSIVPLSPDVFRALIQKDHSGSVQPYYPGCDAVYF
jgi:hypothetical protein